MVVAGQLDLGDPFSPSIAFVFLLFPTGRLRSPRWRPAAWFVGGAFGLTTVALMVVAASIGRDPFKYSSRTSAYLAVLTAFLLLLSAALVVAVTARKCGSPGLPVRSGCG